MIREMLTLREIARRLDVPPSSIAYYKDRFARFLPPGEGRGRRVRYPAHVLDIFREIRGMYTRNMAAEQIEARLTELGGMQSAETGDAPRADCTDRGTRFARGAGGGASTADRPVHRAHGATGESQRQPGMQAEGPVEGLAGVLDRMATLLEVQGHMLAELGALRRQVEELRADRDALLASFAERAARLDKTLELARRERAEAVSRLVEDYYAATTGSGRETSRRDDMEAEAPRAEGEQPDGSRDAAAGAAGTGAENRAAAPDADADAGRAGRAAFGDDDAGSAASGDDNAGSAAFGDDDAGSAASGDDNAGSAAFGTNDGAKTARDGSDRKCALPPPVLFDRPLVIRRKGEFLGVSGRDRVFTLRELLLQVERHAASRHRVAMTWERHGTVWVLRIAREDAAGGPQGEGRVHELTLQPVVTPNGNEVTRLSRLAINGDTVPERFLLELFRNIRESYEGR